MNGGGGPFDNKRRPEQPGGDGTTSPVPRWADRPRGSARPEDRVAALLQNAEPAQGLDASAHDRVLSRLTARPARRSPRLMIRWALASVVLFSSGVVAASMGLTRWLIAPRVEVAPASESVQRRGPTKPRAHPAPVLEPAANETPPPPAMVPAPVAPTSARPTTGRTSRPAPPRSGRLAWVPPAAPVTIEAPPPARPSVFPPSHVAGTERPLPVRPASPAALPLSPPPPAVAPPSVLSLETAILKRALLSLRGRDAARALVDLDDYLARFPSGVLRREAAFARIDALLALGEDTDALRALDRVAFGVHGRDQELQLIRGELRARQRCGVAIADFDRVLATSPPPAFAERALRGRAACRLRVGDREGAAQDLSTYLQRFPTGRFGAEARAILSGSTK